MSVKMPDLLNYWTVDSVAECIDGVGQELSRKLWSFVTADHSPLGKVAWETFTDEEKVELAAAIAKEFPEEQWD
ncbi:hypothetical protein ACVD67_18230 [Klebsiella quasipneumoniae]|uniref:hypothetical protein n=1 Tax=Klebsiella pneumoniae TaxID=573 RepID=UPI001D1977B6|nr:hypothetical protein [Klebsiella pneumoniae]